MGPHPLSGTRGEFRPGRVASVDEGRHTARVTFPTTDGDAQTWDLSVLVTFGGDYSLPAVDTQVLCVILDGRLGVGFVLGAFYSDEDTAPLGDAGLRSIAGEDLRLGDPEAEDKIALAPPVNGNFDDLKSHFDAVWQVVTGAPINEPGNGAPSAFQSALAIAIGTSPYPSPADVDAENVSAK